MTRRDWMMAIGGLVFAAFATIYGNYIQAHEPDLTARWVMQQLLKPRC